MSQASANFETGTHGNTVATTDPGSATAWDLVTIGTNATFAYDNTQPAHGSLAGRINSGANGNDVFGSWTTGIGTLVDHYGRMYIYLSAYPQSLAPAIVSTLAAGTREWIQIDTSGVIILSSAATQVAIGTVAVSLNTWVRIEWHIVQNINGSFEVKLFNSSNSTTPSETISATGINTGTNITQIRFGKTSAATTNFIMYMDDIIAGASSYPGPILTGVELAPPIYGRGAA